MCYLVKNLETNKKKSISGQLFSVKPPNLKNVDCLDYSKPNTSTKVLLPWKQRACREAKSE